MGNAANQVMSTQEYLDEVYEVETPYTKLVHEHYGTEFPFWDETAMFSVLDTSNVLNSTTCQYKSLVLNFFVASSLAYDESQSTLTSMLLMHLLTTGTLLDTRRR